MMQASHENDEHLTHSFSSRPIAQRFSFTQHNATRPPQSRVDLVNAFGYLNFKGPILLKSAELDIGVLEEFEENKHSAVAGNANYEARLRDIWVGRKVAVGQRHLIDVYDVKKRVHIGNTSMEAEASLLMANLAHAKSGACFYDPFAGTGSMLLTCAHFGAHVIGSDIGAGDRPPLFIRVAAY